MGGRFVSEFGMEAYPHLATLNKCITREEDRYPGSMTMDFHNKAIGHERRLVSYVAENFKIRYDLPAFTHLTQVMQADAMSWSYKAWRRQWGTTGDRKCGGVLVWQLNDCWPTMSWAVVDYYLVPKPAYFAIKRAMEPVAIAVQRKYKPWTFRPADETWQRDTGHVDMKDLWKNAEFDIWVTNSTLKELEGEVVVKCFSIKTGHLMKTTSEKSIKISLNGTTAVLENHVIMPDSPNSDTTVDPFVVHVSFLVNGSCVANDTAWPDPIKYLHFDDRGIEVQYSDDKSSISITAVKPVKGFVFSQLEGVMLSDNGFDLVPGFVKNVNVKGCAADQLSWVHVGM